MHRPPRIARARAIALPSPHHAVTAEWLVAAAALVAILAGLLAA